MWAQWKNKIKGLFVAEEIDESDEPKTTRTQSQQTQQKMQAKVKYQYPDKTPFRFPLIPDNVEQQKQQKETKDIPAYQRNRVERVRRSREKVENIYNLDEDEIDKNKLKSVIKNNNSGPFIPSQVASPIYGYQKRKKQKEIENIPSFVRKKEREESEPLEVIEEVTSNQEVFFNKPTEEKETSSEEDKQITDIFKESKDNRNKENKQTEIKPKQIHNRPRENLKQHKNSQQKSERPIPFNVMMTPNDKKVLQGQRTVRNSNIKTEDTKPDKIKETLTTERQSVPYHLLNDPERATSEDRLWVQGQQELLEKTLKHFNVRAKVVNATQGPSVTRFEVQPELGVKVSKIRNLIDDIKMNMSAKDIRIEAPIPGKNTIGIEVPNLNPQMVGLQEILETDSFQQSKSPLTIALGLTVEGLPLVTNIEKMPHGLIAGATGSGKSVCINTILISLLYKSCHEDVKFLLIDPKMVELAPYNGLPHLVAPVITDVKAATAALKWAVNEMNDRYERFVQEGVRDIDRFNRKIMKQDRSDEKMPYIVIVIDELADLMMASPQDVEDAICRIAQKARACGMHLLVATQRPSVDVITGLIKANIPTRIAFSVSSQVDSRTIIDTNGAERLLGKGDMLFIENGSGKSIRLQGAFVSDEEIERVTNYQRTISPPNYLFEQDQLLKQIEMDEDEDEILEEAIQFVVEQNNISTSLLQRQFRIGYNRAARLIDTLEGKGIISGQNGSKPRDVLLSKIQVEQLT